MNLIKIGRFIADCRKEKKITQEQLAEKLYITDRAVSKWERGLSLPDADKMLELCNILGISVNELLNGEKIMKEDYKKKTEELLIELTKKEEEVIEEPPLENPDSDYEEESEFDDEEEIEDPTDEDLEYTEEYGLDEVYEDEYERGEE